MGRKVYELYGKVWCETRRCWRCADVAESTRGWREAPRSPNCAAAREAPVEEAEEELGIDEDPTAPYIQRRPDGEEEREVRRRETKSCRRRATPPAAVGPAQGCGAGLAGVEAAIRTDGRPPPML